MLRWLFIVVLVSCSASSGGPVPAATTTLLPPLEATATSVPPTSSTVAAAFAVPPVIDLPYVQRVLEAIYHLNGEATRHAYAVRGPDAESDERMEAIFGGPRLVSAKKVLRDLSENGYRVFANPPGDAKVRAMEIVQAIPTCMIVRADLDLGPQYRDARPSPSQVIIQIEAADPLPYNPTGWRVVGAGTPINSEEDLRTC